MKYENPVIRGFYPDPSVCNANGKYYLVCSSFHYFPSIPLFESGDLVNWTQIGWCLTRKSQISLEETPSSGGIFACTIRFHEGRFYVVTTDDSRHKNFYVYTDDIYGEWSDPVEVEQGGIDPSLLFDEGRVYFTSNGRDENNEPCIYQCEIDISSGAKLTESRIIWKGSGGRLVEGPHLYRIGSYYYLLAAEGGTEYGHMVTCARALSPYGPFTGYRGNPVLTNRDRGDDEIQGAGHGDLVQDTDGNWWMTHLAFRQTARWRQYHHLGREVFLEPVYWDENGWFSVGERGIAQKTVTVPGVQKEIVQSRPSGTDFSEGNWSLGWSFIRNPVMENYRIEKNRLRLRGSRVSVSDAGSPTFIGLRQQDFDCVLKVCVNVPSGEAGVCIYMDELHHYDVFTRRTQEGTAHVVRICIGGISGEFCAPASGCGNTCIEIRSCKQKYVMQIGEEDEVVLEREMESRYLSSEVAGGFTGVLFGLYAYDEEGCGLFSEFRDFSITCPPDGCNKEK